MMQCLSYDYMAYMDYINLNAWCPRNIVKLDYSLIPIKLLFPDAVSKDEDRIVGGVLILN